ncbi:MAG: hypothetical protein E7016_01015 [Alphaproteobacteria bacterium]|nr:hypothetical protein [Alphaproteobacteria bacterium]
MKDELFIEAMKNVEQAIKLGTSVMCGHIKVAPEEFMVLYCLLRDWQDRMGKDVPDPINKLVNHIEHIVGDSLPVFRECYELTRMGSPMAKAFSAIAEDVETGVNDDTSAQPFFIPIPRNKYVS